MIVASYNVNSVRARMPIVLQWLEKNRPNVLCVQETKVQDVDFPLSEFESIGYHCAFKGQKTYNGVAIISREPLDEVHIGLDSEPKDEPRLIAAASNGIHIVNTYVPQGRDPDSEHFQYKLEWFGRLGDYFSRHFKTSDLLVWMGDLNIAPEPRDVHSPETLLGHVCFHPKVHKALAKVMDWGFVDVFRKHCDEPGQYTFYDYRARNSVQRNRGWRLDHIMATKPLAQKSTACFIDKEPRLAEKPSDHTPVVAAFNI